MLQRFVSGHESRRVECVTRRFAICPNGQNATNNRWNDKQKTISRAVILRSGATKDLRLLFCCEPAPNFRNLGHVLRERSPLSLAEQCH